MIPDDDQVGRLVLGRYRIVRPIARGGQGVIYLARTEGAAGFVKPVVVKRILPHFITDEMMVRMFIREATILANLRHPSIVSVMDFARDGDSYVMVLDYVHGYHLGRWARFVRETRGQFGVEPLLHIVCEVLDALQHAHDQRDRNGQPLQIVHRDVTPANILVDLEGHIKLADFGIARIRTDVTQASGSQVTVKGSFPYIAPELFEGKDPSPKSDIYSCGVVLHELLSGKNVFRGSDVRETMMRAMTLAPPRMDTVRSDVSAELADAIEKALEKNPAMRFASAAEFRRVLQATRKISGEEAGRIVAEQVLQDFTDPRIAPMLKVEPLSVLDEAWRADAGEDVALRSSRPPPQGAPSPLSEQRDHAPVHARSESSGSTSDAPTRAAAEAVPVVVPPRSSLLWVAVSVSVVVGVAALGVVGWVVTRPVPAVPQAQFIVVQQGGNASPLGTLPGDRAVVPSDPATQDAGPAAAAAIVDSGARAAPAATKLRPAPAGPGDEARQLSRAFARQQSRVTACFEQHAASLVGSPQLSVHFRVAISGRVEAAEILPASVASTPLGACLAAVAGATEFGPQSGPIAFRIPITARRE